jgi:hypothetical protein
MRVIRIPFLFKKVLRLIFQLDSERRIGDFTFPSNSLDFLNHFWPFPTQSSIQTAYLFLMRLFHQRGVCVYLLGFGKEALKSLFSSQLSKNYKI